MPAMPRLRQRRKRNPRVGSVRSPTAVHLSLELIKIFESKYFLTLSDPRTLPGALLTKISGLVYYGEQWTVDTALRTTPQL